MKTTNLCHFLQVQDGAATVSHHTAKINDQLQKELNQTLSDLQQSGEKLYLGVFVTNIRSKGHAITLYTTV